MKTCAAFLPIVCSGMAFAEPPESFRYQQDTRASQFAKEFFGPHGNYNRTPGLNMGRVGLDVATELDCGKLDVRANIRGEFNKIQEQVKAIIPKTASDVRDLLSRTAMITTCYAYPTVCAQLRHDFLSLQANLNLRAQACQAIDKFIDSQADKGAKQLRAEAQADCVNAELRRGVDPATATGNCQGKTGLGIRDFQAGLEKKFTREKQKVLRAVVSFAQARDATTYDFLASLLGEIEVQSDGYWQPLFTAGMLRPHDVAQGFLAEGERAACGDLVGLLRSRGPRGRELTERTVTGIIRKRLTADDAANLEDLGAADRQLACAALGRALGQVAAERAAAESEAVVASGLLNTAIPQGLREEYRSRTASAFVALRRAVESEQIPPVEEVRRAISDLARATRERNRLMAAGLSASKVENERQRATVTSDCVDTLSCGGGAP